MTPEQKDDLLNSFRKLEIARTRHANIGMNVVISNDNIALRINLDLERLHADMAVRDAEVDYRNALYQIRPGERL